MLDQPEQPYDLDARPARQVERDEIALSDFEAPRLMR
jgi:hypothetical protein